MEDVIFCPGCGTRIANPGRYCPSCHEPLPAPKTIVGFGDIPAQEPVVPAPAEPVTVGIAFDKTLDAVTPSPLGAKAQGTFPGHPSPTPAGPMIVNAPVVADSQAQELPNSRMAVSVREPVLVDSPVLGGSTTPGFAYAPAAVPGLAGEGTLQTEPEAQPAASPSASLAVQQPVPLEPSAPVPATGLQPPPAEVAAPPVIATPQQSSTEPHPGPPAAAFDPPPQQPFVYGQPSGSSLLQPPPYQADVASPGQPQATDSDLAPTDTRKGLVWRAFAGGALLTWTLLYGLTACVFVLVHLTLSLKHGFGVLHESTYATFGVAASALVPAVLLMAASLACLTGRGWPRVLAAIGALSHVGWTGITIYVLAENFVLARTASYGAVACGLSALFTIVWVIVLLAGGKWIGKSKPGKPARAVPYPLWAGPLLIVLGTLSIVREVIQIVRVGVEMADGTQLARAAEEVRESYPLFFAGAAGLLVSVLLVVAGIALLRRKRWAIGLGGAAGLFMLVADGAAILVLYVWDDISNHGGPLIGLVDVFILLAYGIGAWVALAGALRFGFALPGYLREAPDKNADGTRPKLLSVLVPTTPPQAEN